MDTHSSKSSGTYAIVTHLPLRGQKCVKFMNSDSRPGYLVYNDVQHKNIIHDVSNYYIKIGNNKLNNLIAIAHYMRYSKGDPIHLQKNRLFNKDKILKISYSQLNSENANSLEIDVDDLQIVKENSDIFNNMSSSEKDMLDNAIREIYCHNDFICDKVLSIHAYNEKLSKEINIINIAIKNLFLNEITLSDYDIKSRIDRDYCFNFDNYTNDDLN